LGDWGTQFGMLLAYIKSLPVAGTNFSNHSLIISKSSLSQLEGLYKKAKVKFDANVNNFQETARAEVVLLQSGDEATLKLWRCLCEKSREEFQFIYNALNIQNLTERGESFYNPLLADLVKELASKGVLEESEGAKVIFLDNHKSSEGEFFPLLIQKSDGGFLYATTDLAALKHRLEVEKADRLVYVVDVSQAKHFEMVFDAARKCQYLPLEKEKTKPTVKHVPFGLVLGEDGKKIKTRSGEAVKLRELLSEAIQRCKDEFILRKTQQQPLPQTRNETVTATETTTEETGGKQETELSDEEKAELEKKSRILGMAAVKYADLSQNRESNYRFSFDKMLFLQGNTAPYMFYAYARIRGIQRKALETLSQEYSVSPDNLKQLEDLLYSNNKGNNNSLFQLQEPHEIRLAKYLLKSNDLLLEVSKTCFPHRVSTQYLFRWSFFFFIRNWFFQICDYLFELSHHFNSFYEHCPVLKAENKELMISRIALCSITAGQSFLSFPLVLTDLYSSVFLLRYFETYAECVGHGAS
jgi:arginyl-tRNA synthetase